MFCSNCGKEVSENAYVCPECGFLLSKKQKLQLEKLKETRNKVFNILLIISFAFTCLVQILPQIQSLVFIKHGYQDCNYDFQVASYIFAFFASVASIVNFVLSFKIENGALRMLSILNFIYVRCINFTVFLAFIYRF